MAKQKIQNQTFWYHPRTGRKSAVKQSHEWIFFGSAIEFRVWILLKTELPEQWAINRQYPVLYKPQTENYSPLYWKVDFEIHDEKHPTDFYLIEVKGDWIYHEVGALSEFQHKIQMLEFVKPQSWKRLVFVGSSKPHLLDNVLSFEIREFQAWLKQKFRSILQ